MSQHHELAVERSTDLDVDVHQLWDLISTAEGWSSWLVDKAALSVAPGATGTAIEDGVMRAVRIDFVTEGRGLGFSWWDRDDPSTVSTVQLDIVELPDGRSQLNITERFVGSATRSTTSSTTTSATVSWDVRLISLWMSIVQAAVLA